MSALPYSRREEWADVQPQWLREEGVVAIQYSEECAEALAYFRAVVAKGERTARVHELAAHVIRLNDADYTAWQVRWECCEALGGTASGLLDGEDALTRSVMASNPKNYQLWNHRRKLAAANAAVAAAAATAAAGDTCGAAEASAVWEAELGAAAAALKADPKNYHAWAHRQHAVRQAQCWEVELVYVEGLLEEDVRNNSAWAQRMFVLQEGPPPGDWAALLRRELHFVAEKLPFAPSNESAWNYLRGVCALPGCRPHEMGYHLKVHTLCCEALADSPCCAPALDTLAEYYWCLACLLTRGDGEGGAAERVRQAAHSALGALQAAAVADPLRGNYWRLRIEEVERGFGVGAAASDPVAAAD